MMRLGRLVGVIASVPLAAIAQVAALAREGEGRIAVQAVVETACSVTVDAALSGTSPTLSPDGKPDGAAPVRVACSDASGFALSVTDEGAAISRQARPVAQAAPRLPARRFYTVTY
jgi:hypothetical protein